ncbi:histidine kinase [Streptomyces sp. Je 1-332]|uniref:sensor histidine kinase n=1 Tax=Streptomyces sp. Je 1-332 TaxID=3231270 RepID=UPI0034596268
MVITDDAGTAVTQASIRWAEVPRVMRSLEMQARLASVACLLVDAVVFVVATPDLHAPVRIGALLGIVCVDAALALPARYSASVAGIHAVAAIGLAVVLHSTPEADLDLVGTVIAAYRAGAWLKGRWSIGALSVLATAAVISQLVADPADLLSVVTEMMKDACIPWLVGRYTSGRRAYITELRHNRENELREATAAGEMAVVRVRASIARDLHDVISHHVSAIGVHAGAARINLAAKPEFADMGIMDSLASVEQSSRSAMSDLRRMLDILHGHSDSTSQPGLGNLDELFDGVRRSGLATRFRVSGTRRGLPESIDVALYQITQEMLTNALRYGNGETVDVVLHFGDTEVVLIARNGIGAPAERGDRPSTGRGLAGIRSRAALFGGTVSHGPDPAGKTWETKVSVYYGASPSGESV